MSETFSLSGNMPKANLNDGPLNINSNPINTKKNPYALDSKLDLPDPYDLDSKLDLPGPYDKFYDKNGLMKPVDYSGNMTREKLNRIGIEARVGIKPSIKPGEEINSGKNPFARGGKSKRKRRKTKRKKSKKRRRKSMRR